MPALFTKLLRGLNTPLGAALFVVVTMLLSARCFLWSFESLIVNAESRWREGSYDGSSERLSLASYASYFNGHRYDSEITAAQVAPTPEWRGGVPPISAADALKAAEQTLAGMFGNRGAWKPARVSIEAVTDTHYYYLLELIPFSLAFNDGRAHASTMRLIVLMDGRVIAPVPK
jgi:hypothetical protein